MTQIQITKRDNNVTIDAIGHATGSVEVCAGISALMYSLEGWMLGHGDEFQHHASIFNDGYARITAKCMTESSKEAVEMIINGLRQIENSYPEYVKVVNA